MTNQLPEPVFVEFTKQNVGELLNIKHVDADLVDKINQLAASTELSENFKENLVTYTSVLNKGSFTPAQYVSAVQYVSYRLMGHDIRPAWEKTFPDRYATLLAKGTASKAIHSHASAYNRTKLVSAVTEQSLIPSYIVNNGLFQKALNIQVKIMTDEDVSPKVRSDAAAKVLEYTAMPDSVLSNKEEVSEKGMDIIAALAKSVERLADTKRASIIEGKVTATEAARMPVYGDVEDAEVISETE